MSGLDDWKGRVGQEWAARADAMEGLLGPVGEGALQALGDLSGQRVLDLGCGAGDTAVALKAAGGLVTGVDVSADLIALAKQRDPEISWRLADAATAAFDEPFDVLYSRCGAMFFDDPVSAYAHLRGQMVPHARLAIAVWRGAAENGWARIPLDAAEPILGAEAVRLPPAGGAGPFGWADPEPVLAMLEKAGWRNVRVAPIDRTSIISTGDDPDPITRATAFTMRIGILAARLRGTDKAVRDAVRDALADRFSQHLTPAGVALPAAGWVYQAENAG
ncbi:class I SAM-dependent methyltransferase [Pontivivens insulae]|uniref:Magnesium-protoporphyrin O-methyltransferase n=1 Tax=Pontivivens insulae TaxID=1639689 RepID=A0A2R8A9M4_9RHOB|nr:class I SAM-dependent methyltransferase [Pontivivens insulae]RED12831.1 ubiquinone/menaquinone biosynthesis C-methylase UbiE [Pontivivens insulae]SPF28922.1 Magnesium-protoporphyrin O-methyltransferase [Pontivivens insulae]